MDMSIHQSKLNSDKSKRQLWNVTITNNCYCSQMNVRIDADGFRTTTRLDPAIIMISKGQGLVNGGQPIYPYTSLGFTYACRVPSHLKLISSQVVCS
ncbi:hypothetical protein RND81_10G149800 [Saponaria officinalis]|uniref:Uncharacterized protein n=1 Tax=Saponaria officinalis TaxID=3572 RepID=A0AAW1I3H4_SAPOF